MIDINKFDDLEDLPVSEEMLGAYLEGNLHGAEFREVQNYVHEDTSLSSLIGNIEADMGCLNDLDYSYQHRFGDILTTEDMFSGISLPELTTYGLDNYIDSSSPLNDAIILGGECTNFIGDDDHFLHSDNPSHGYNHHDPELDNGMSDNFE